MNPLESILVATDFSAPANNAVRRAALLARHHGAGLRIIHVVDRIGPYPGLRDRSYEIEMEAQTAKARVNLRRLADELSNTFNVTADIAVTIGDPFQVLVNESSRASLVVLGRRAGASIKDWVFGTTAGRLLDTAGCPVLVVKQTVEGRYRRVLAGIDFTPTSDAAALFAAALAPAAELHLTHVLQSKQSAALIQTDVPSTVLRELREREESGIVARMRRRVASIGLDSGGMRFAVARGTNTPTILNQEQIQGADMVAVGRRQRTRWLDALLGSVSRRVLARAQNDVLVVPSRPALPAVPRASESRQPAGSRVHSAESALRWWTIEADPANTRAPAWQTGTGAWSTNPSRS